MTCREATEALTESVEAGLSRAQRWRLDRHLFSCISCAAYRQTYEMTITLERVAFAPPGDGEALPDSLVASIPSRRRLAVPLATVK